MRGTLQLFLFTFLFFLFLAPALSAGQSLSEGNIALAELDKGSTAILLSNDVDDIAQYMGNRSGNTPTGYRVELDDIAGNLAETNGRGDQSGQILPFTDQNFAIVDPPTLRFTTVAQSVEESAGSATLTVELVEANGTAVSVDVAFLSGSSTADATDIGNYTTETVSFGSTAASGATQTVTVNVNNDDTFEGDERATFQLQNNTAGSITEPTLINVTITDDDTPAIVFNEINADPGDDANGDGVVDSDSDEFIEWVNNSTRDIDISGWTYNDSGSAEFTFPDGTVIAAGNAFVLFDDGGGAQPQGNFGAAYVFTDDEVGLNNESETLTLSDANGNVVVSTTYPNEADRQSNNLSPDGTGSVYVDHSSLSGGSLSSPGTQVDGTIWGEGTFAISFSGNEGYRFIGTPSQNTTFDDLFTDLWTQGIPGSDAPSAGPNIFGWQEGDRGGVFSTVSGMGNNLTPGQGYIIYVFADDQFTTPGLQGGFPKVISTDNPENASTVQVAVSATDEDKSGDINGNEGYNLLSNPYGTDISVAAVIDALEAVDPAATVNANIFVWDHRAGGGNGGFESLSEGDQIAPFQAFFIRYTDEVSGNVSFDRNVLAANNDAEFYDQPAEKEPSFNFEMHLDNGEKFDTYKVQFNENGTIGEDRLDGYKLLSLNSDALSLYSTVGNGVQLAQNVLPSVESLKGEGELRISLAYNVYQPGEYSIRWSDLDGLPQDFDLYLVDNETGRKVDMRVQKQHQFNVNVIDEQQSTPKPISPTIRASNDKVNSKRFELVIATSNNEQEVEEPLEQPVVLSSNYPNPFNSQTTMDLQLREKMHVNVTVWNIVGQKVGTMMDKTMDAGGPYPMTWNVPANMPSGIYICKVEAGGMVLTRKMTLVK